jgi:hypothetical protein
MRNVLSPGEQALLARFIELLLARADPGAVTAVRVFGSRARGASHERSDLDVAVLAAPGADQRRLRDAAADAAWDAMAAMDAFGLALAPVVLPPQDGPVPTGIYSAVARDGITLWPRT